MGFFISFEGPDGGGKSTQARRLAAWLRGRGHMVTETREPGGTALGDRLRELVLDPKSPHGSTLAMALIISASRAQLLEEVIRPALDRGECVIVDRYTDSTIAYQGWGGKLPLTTVQSLNAIATGGLMPDLVIYIHVPPDFGLARVRTRGGADRLDAEALEFHQRVQVGYQALIKQDPDRWLVVDGSLSPDEVESAIISAMELQLERIAGVA